MSGQGNASQDKIIFTEETNPQQKLQNGQAPGSLALLQGIETELDLLKFSQGVEGDLLEASLQEYQYVIFAGLFCRLLIQSEGNISTNLMLLAFTLIRFSPIQLQRWIFYPTYRRLSRP